MQSAVKDCQIRLFVLSQMCTNMNKQKEKGKKEKERGIEQFHSSKYSSLYFINCYLKLDQLMIWMIIQFKFHLHYKIL